MALITKDLNTPGLNAQQLAEFIVGDTGTVIPGSAKFTGDNRASGTFGGGISEGINVEAGVIFSTGEIKNANGPNNSDSQGSDLKTAGDPVTLDPIVAPETTKNAAILEFEFIAKQSQFSLEYVFASEEYNEFVNQYNDVFAFVLNGVNIPLIPGTTQPVSINTINLNKNSAFYIDNDPTTYGLGKTPHNTQFDGFTKLLTAQGTVIPNITNKLRIAIADTRDELWDSAIFLNVPPSFNFSQPTYQVKEDGKVIGAAVTINRTGITNGTSKIDVKLSNGSATGGATLGLGVDFVFTTQTISFAPNQTTAEVIVPINDDSLVEPTENITLTLTNPASARIGITQNTATLNITDNDTTGITITSTGGNTAVTESGTTDTYTAVLNSQPASLVILTVKPDKQTDLGTGSGNPIALNFSPANWNVPQTVTVKAVDDDVTEASPHTSTILHTASSTDPNYDGSTPPIRIDGTAIATLTANITDNDIPSVKITETGGTTKLGEGGASDNYTAVLTSQPAADVTVTASPDSQSDVGAGGGNPIALKFTPDNWNVPQVVTVQAVDDAVDQGAHSSTIAHKVTSTDAKYNAIATASVTAQITDNDTAGVTISPPNTTATEGGATGSYKLALTSKPTAPVKVNFNTGIQIQSISTFTFTSDNWNIPQTVTVKATDDSLVEELHSGTINHSIAPGSAAEYLPAAIAPVTVSITDNDVANPSTPSVSIAPASTNATEGGATGSYKVSLNTKPTANVTVNVAAGSQINAIAPFVFTPVNWNVPQTVTVTATDDTVVEGSHSATISHSVAAGSAAEYLPVAIAPVSVTIADNDTATSTAGVKISPTSTTAAEGGATGSYSAVLTSQPASDVKVSFATDSEIEAIAPFTFTVANWNVPQTATVKAADDSAVEGTQLSTIVATASSTDLAYNKIGIPKVDVLILDNDSPGIAVTPNSTNATEGGATGSYSVVLTKAPTANVTVNFAAGSEINAIAPIAFTPANWNVPQTVTVTATDDTVVEGSHSATISHSVAPGSAAEYLSAAIAPVSVTIADNDTATTAAGVSVTQTGGSTIVAEGGTTDTYQVALNSQPKNDVKVSFATDSQIEAIAPFTFTVANWNLPQTATVKAADDSAVEGTQLSTITFSASSTDLAYNTIGIPKVDVLILDNDSPGIAVTPNSTNAAEGGATGSYSVVLTKAPTANVTVNFAPGGQIDAIAPIVFTPANWNAAQTVTVKATDDTIVEGTHTGLIFSSVAQTSAAEYLPVAIAPVSVTIADNDTAPPTPTPVINFSPTIIVPTPTPVINFSPTIIVPTPTPEPTPTPVINFSPTIIVPAPTPEPTPTPISEPTPTPISEPTPTPISEPTPTPTPTPISEPTPVPTPPTADPDCICAQITLPQISPLHGFNPVDNNLVGGNTNESLAGGSGGDGINGLAGDDVLVGSGGNDNLVGGFISNVPVGPLVDRDLLLGGPGDDYLNGQAGYDTLFGGEGNDAGFGGKDNDTIWGGLGADTVVGEEGNDSLYGGTNSESDRDRTGNDLLFGAKGNDYLSGQDASDSLSGGDGSDTARGGKGNDVILGDSGSDLLLGDRGNDSLCGGDGDDTLYGDIGSPLPVGVAGGQDQVCGGSGNDLLFGNEGSDTINGDTGNDTILGGKDSDSLAGGAGNDVLIGDEGSDTLLGGSGRDLFFLTSGQGSDIISDFLKGEDLLSLAGGLTFAQLSISPSTDGQNASPSTFIRIASSGELLAVLNGVQASAIAPSDFVQILRIG